jgi:hypothetical protein
MRTINTKPAIRVFSAIVAFEAAIVLLDFVVPDHWLIIPWWLINFPSFPLFCRFEDMVPRTHASTICLLIGTGLLSASLWSAAAGFVLRRKSAA